MIRRSIDTVFIVMFGLLLSVFSMFCHSENAKAASAGDPDYISMHSYVSPTEIKGVYRVVTTLTTPPVKTEKGAVYVAITLDGSGSMGSSDVYDSSGRFTGGGPGDVSRYVAMEAAVEATLASLIADGNKNIYINISSHDGNSTDNNDAGSPGTPTGMPLKLNALADASGFVSLYDSSGNLRPIFDSANRGSGFVMDGWPTLNTQTPLTNAGGWSGYYNSNDFALAFERIHGIFAKGLVNGTIPTTSARYILGMGDGDDWGAFNSGDPTVARSTQEWATAIKAPLDANYKSGGSLTPAVGYAGTGSGGLGGVIWSVAVGSAIRHDVSWKADIFQSNWQTTMAGGGFPLAEPRLIYNTVPIPESKVNDPSIVYGSSATKIWSDAFIDATLQPWYSGQTANNAADGDTHYTYSCFLFDNNATNSYGGTSLAAGFADFGEAAASAATLTHTGLDSELNINSQAYNLYKFPGKPLLETLSSDPTVSINATVNGNQISWNIAQLSSQAEVTLIFYIKMDDSLLDSSDYYPVFDSSTLTYIPATSTTGLPVTVSYPAIYISGNGNTKSDDSSTTSTTAAEVSTPTVKSEGLIPIAGLAGNDGKPYTPSVTPQNNTIQNESLQEDAESVPVTSDSTRVVILVSGILVVIAACILYRKRKRC